MCVCVRVQDFVLKFFFSENDWFSNSCLTKSYKMACEVDEDDPFSFEGAAITSCEGYIYYALVIGRAPHFLYP